VLKRPVGGKGAFSENAVLPKDWALDPDGELPNPGKNAKAKGGPKRAPKTKAGKAIKDDNAGRAAIISFEREKARRECEREQVAAREEARAEKARARRERDNEKAQAALERAQARHDQAMEVIEHEREKLERRARNEKDRWDEERDELKAVLHSAGET
jgi:hypothetical protein